MKIALGCDHGGYELKEYIKGVIEKMGHEYEDFGCYSLDSCDYADHAAPAARAVASGECDRGILICGTGIGMSIVANKVPGVRAAQCHDTFSAERARKSNNAQIITLGARVIGTELGKKIIQAWLESEYEGGGSAPKVERIDYYEHQHARD